MVYIFFNTDLAENKPIRGEPNQNPTEDKYTTRTSKERQEEGELLYN
jgi:hypothetical protein